MKILLLAPGCSGYKILELYTNISKDLLILGRSKYKKKFKQIFSQSKKISNIKVKFKKSLLFYLLTSIRLSRNYDIIISQDPFSAFCASLTKKKKIFIMCQDFIEYLKVLKINSLSKHILYQIYTFFLKFSCKRCNIICLSKHIKNSATKYGAKNPKIIPIYGVDTKLFSKKKSNFKKILKIKDKLILCVSKLEPYKGTEYLIKALILIKKEYPDIQLILIGAGSLKNHLESLIKKLKLEKNVKMLGEIPSQNLPAYYNACDIFVLPSIKEGLGFVLAEALACEKPVIASRTGGIPDIVIENKTGILVAPKNIKELSLAIIKILKNKKLAKKLAKEGKKHVLLNFEEDKVLNSFRKYLFDIMHER